MKSGRSAASPPPGQRKETGDKKEERADESKTDVKEKRGSKEKEKEGKETKEREARDTKEKERLALNPPDSEIEVEIRSARLERVESAHLRALVSDAGQIVKLNVGGTRYFSTKVRTASRSVIMCSPRNCRARCSAHT